MNCRLEHPARAMFDAICVSTDTIVPLEEEYTLGGLKAEDTFKYGLLVQLHCILLMSWPGYPAGAICMVNTAMPPGATDWGPCSPEKVYSTPNWAVSVTGPFIVTGMETELVFVVPVKLRNWFPGFGVSVMVNCAPGAYQPLDGVTVPDPDTPVVR